MTGFKLDFSDVSQGGGLKDGTYEVMTQLVKEDASKSGSIYIDMALVVRNDIDQEGKNGLIFHRVWQAKETGKYNPKSLAIIADNLNLDRERTYNSLDELLEAYSFKPVKVTVKNEESEYNGKTYNNLNVKRWAKTDYPNVAHQWKEGKGPGANTANPFGGANVEIDENDLPF